METIEQFLHEIETEIDLVYTYEEGMSFSDFEDAVLEYINETEIIYYGEAIDYLAKVFQVKMKKIRKPKRKKNEKKVLKKS